MKLLIFHCWDYWYSESSVGKKQFFPEGIVAFIHAEKEDEAKKHISAHAADQIAWLARKVGISAVVLHSFAHLSDSKSSRSFATKVIADIGRLLERKKYTVHTTPHTSLEFMLHVAQEPVAKLWKAL
ncbi:hypothetical protein HY639_00385 [Candidatus Woesearchaeota archaeon]|nr:hypothetical protein [Candidatus Woesearchaeota archaeon]